MSPIVLLGAAALAGFALLRKPAPVPTGEGQELRPGDLPPSLLTRFEAAVRSGSASEMRRLAVELRRAGFGSHADELERLAREIAADGRAPAAPPSRSRDPIIDVTVPPPGAQPVNPPEPIQDVVAPPPGAEPVDDMARRIPPGTEQLVADYARMVYASAPSGPVKDLELSEAFKKAAGVRGDKKFYGQGPALALIQRGVVPPTPWDWQRAAPEQDKASYRRQLGQAKREDPERADLWDSAIAVV